MHAALRNAIESEFRTAASHRAAGRYHESFHHLERAHVLGQEHWQPHTRAHWEMLRIGWLRRDRREIAGQLVRLLVAPVASATGVLPVGNTGGANVRATKPMPIPPDLRRLLELNHGSRA